jgi:chemotaxis signal transduction protein
MTTFCTLQHGEHQIGFEMAYVVEVLEHLGTVPVPRTPPFVMGIGMHRNEMLPMLDLRSFIGAGMSSLISGPDSRVLILADEQLRFAIIGAGLQTIECDLSLAEPHPDSALYPALITQAESPRGPVSLIDIGRLSASLQQSLGFEKLIAA